MLFFTFGSKQYCLQIFFYAYVFPVSKVTQRFLDINIYILIIATKNAEEMPEVAVSDYSLKTTYYRNER